MRFVPVGAVTLLIATLVALPTAAHPATAQAPTCKGRDVTILGTDGADNLRGTNKRDRRGTGLAQVAADRPIFTLSVAADLLGLHPRTLRIYEEKGLVIPSRTEGNRRRYSQNDIQRFQFIRQLTRSGVNLEGVRIILDMADELNRLGGDAGAIIERSSQAQSSDET